MDYYLWRPTKDEVKKLFIKEKVLLQLIMFYKLYRAFEQVSKSTADWNRRKGIVELAQSKLISKRKCWLSQQYFPNIWSYGFLYSQQEQWDKLCKQKKELKRACCQFEEVWHCIFCTAQMKQMRKHTYGLHTTQFHRVTGSHEYTYWEPSKAYKFQQWIKQVEEGFPLWRYVWTGQIQIR